VASGSLSVAAKASRQRALAPLYGVVVSKSAVKPVGMTGSNITSFDGKGQSAWVPDFR